MSLLNIISTIVLLVIIGYLLIMSDKRVGTKKEIDPLILGVSIAGLFLIFIPFAGYGVVIAYIIMQVSILIFCCI
jgi:hypothetical protein